MRIKSSLWVSAYLRRVMLDGAFGVVLRHGDDDAGAIFVKIVDGDQLLHFFSPAPSYALEPGAARKWLRQEASDERLTSVLQREEQIDPDFWLIEVDDRSGRTFLDDDEIYVESDDGLA